MVPGLDKLKKDYAEIDTNKKYKYTYQSSYNY